MSKLPAKKIANHVNKTVKGLLRGTSIYGLYICVVELSQAPLSQAPRMAMQFAFKWRYILLPLKLIYQEISAVGHPLKRYWNSH
jgi:hypothetical protein